MRTIAKVLKYGIDLTFTVAMLTKIGRQNGLKIGKWPFWSKFDTCNRGINIEHMSSQYQKDILRDDENYNGTQYIKRFFWYSLVLISNS